MLVDVKLFDDLDAVAADAGDLLDRDRQPVLFDRIDWFRLVADHVVTTPIRVLRARNAGGSAWLFLADRGGGKAEALGCWYTLAFAPVFASADHPALLAAIAKLARRHFWWIALSPLAEEVCDLVLAAFRATGWHGLATLTTVNRRIDVSAGFEDYWAHRSTRLRNTVRRKAKAGDIAIEIADGFDPALWADYETVYAHSWKPAEGSPAMLRALVEMEGAAGTLRLGIARHEGVPVAAQFWLVEHGRATIHKLAHVEGAKALSPGTVLSAAMFRHVIDRDHPTWIDFGTGDDPYKAEWMNTAHDLWRVDLRNPRDPRGLARIVRSWAGALVRRRKAG